GAPLRDERANGRLGVFELVGQPHASRSVQKKGKRDGSALVPLEHVDVDRDSLNMDTEVFFLETLDKSAFLIQDLRWKEDILGPGAFRIGRNRGSGRWKRGTDLLRAP